jgi:thiamine pyrophosphokinase
MALFMSRVVIFANGLISNIRSAQRLLREDDYLIAADGGTKHILGMGMVPAIIIGDLDSLNAGEQEKVQAGGTRIMQHPQDKNETDFELALEFALKEGYRELLVIGAFGGRLDQVLGNLSVLSGMDPAGLDICADDGTEEARFIHDRGVITGMPGDVVSLLPWGGPVSGITTGGLRWPLQDETLFANKTRGISNELVNTKASITIRSGLLLVIHRRKPIL